MSENIREKIKKLLALSGSSNEHEAQVALLMARKLMAKNKLTEEDFREDEHKLVHFEVPEVKWTTDSGNVWMSELCALIAENHCCNSAWKSFKGRRTYTLVLTGFKSDAEVCREIITYAVGFVLNKAKAQERKGGKAAKISYAQGFIAGLNTAYYQQNADHSEWGLVLVKPDEVKKYEEGLKEKSVRTREHEFDALAYLRGQRDGLEFNAKKVLEGCQ